MQLVKKVLEELILLYKIVDLVIEICIDSQFGVVW